MADGARIRFSLADDLPATVRNELDMLPAQRQKEFLEEWSPANHADRIKAPVFMAYGLRDPRVNIRHAQVMENAMEDAGVTFELMIKKDEGHGFRKEENRFDFYGRMESFLADNIGPGQASNVNP